MNARKAAKYYKKHYNNLKNQCDPKKLQQYPPIRYYHPQTYKFESVLAINNFYNDYPEEYIVEKVKSKLIHDLINDLGKDFIEITSEYDRKTNITTYRANIEILK